MKIYLIIIITLFILIILPLIIFYIAMYIRNRRFSNIKGDRPPDPSVNPNPDNDNLVNPNPDVPKEPYIISAYKHSLNLTGYGLNIYEIKCTFYNNKTLHIDMDVYDNKKQIATNAFHDNKWDIVSDGYDITYDSDLLYQVKNVPLLTCTLDNHIKYISGSPNKIIVTGNIKAGIIPLPNITEIIEQCNNIDCT